MLYVIYGKDSIKARKKLHELLDWAKKKRPEAELFKITTENWSSSQFEELLVSQGLFDTKYTVVLDGLFEKKDIKEFIVDKVEEISQSDQLFFLLDTTIDAASLKKIEKYAKQIQEFLPKEDKKNEPNVFAVTSGLLERDKRRLWVDYTDLLRRGGVPEEIHGIFFWQIKNMIIASRAKSQTETGLSPYAYKNALSGTRKFRTEELLKMSSDLVEITHKVRTGMGDMAIMLERWVLSV